VSCRVEHKGIEALATEGALQRIETLVLAGGAGARFGGAKLTTAWRDGLLIDGALTSAFAAPARAVTVVTGADPAVNAAARAFAARTGQTSRLRLIHAADHTEGMAASLRAGLAGLPPDTAGAFVFLGDMPRIPANIPPALAEAFKNGAEAAAPVFEGRRGHPVLFGRSLFAKLLGLHGDDGARAVLSGLGEALALVEALDAGVLFDVDLAGDRRGPDFRS